MLKICINILKMRTTLKIKTLGLKCPMYHVAEGQLRPDPDGRSQTLKSSGHLIVFETVRVEDSPGRRFT